MATPTQILPAPARPTGRRISSKTLFWLVLALAAASVVPFTEIPTIRGAVEPWRSYHAELVADRALLIPHAICGTLALVLGPVQFSSRLRRRYLAMHRILGRVYVTSVFIAAPMAIAMSALWHREFVVGTTVQAGAWIVCTLAAFLTARNRHILQHRQWMIRSYAVTFTFVGLRVLNPFPWFANLSSADGVLAILVATFLAVLLPDIAFSWRELTRRHA